jgi:hypothetical protein
MTLCRSRRRQVFEMHCCRSFCWAHNPKVGGSNPPPATNLSENSLNNKLALYLQEVELLRKPGTLRECKRICPAAIPFIAPDDPRSGVLAFLAHRKSTGIDARTLENERIRVTAFLKHAGLRIEPKIPKFRFVVRKPGDLQQGRVGSDLSIFGACRAGSGSLVFPHPASSWTQRGGSGASGNTPICSVRAFRSRLMAHGCLKTTRNGSLRLP